jgi:D-glycero-D-manno-heptose 1,7-bisphosphate phosphatase
MKIAIAENHCQVCSEQIGERFGAELKEVHAVGDSLRDAQAAAASGCMPHLVLTGKGEQSQIKICRTLFQPVPAYTPI